MDHDSISSGHTIFKCLTPSPIGPAHCTLSSDAGEPLFPNSVESLRLLRGHMSAFGCTPDEIYTMCTVNPSFIVGLSLTTTQRARGITGVA